MCVAVVNDGFIGVQFPSEEGIFTSLKGSRQKRAADRHKFQKFRFRKNFQVNKTTET